MKALLWTASVVVTVAALLGVSRLGADGKGEKAKPASLRTRIGLVNLYYVVRNYEKYKDFQEALKDLGKPYEEQAKEWQAEIEKLNKELQAPDTTPEEKASIQKTLEKLNRHLLENQAEVKNAAGKRSAEAMLAIYLEMEETVARVAKSRGLDLVLSYTDGTTETEVFNLQNVARKMQNGALIPLYVAPGMDISKDVAKALNQLNNGNAR
jgi:outer membrane protein